MTASAIPTARVQNTPRPAPVKASEEPDVGLRPPELPGSEPPEPVVDGALMGTTPPGLVETQGAVVVVVEPAFAVVVVVDEPGPVVDVVDVVDDVPAVVLVVVLDGVVLVVVVVPPL